MKEPFCFWSIATGPYARMAERLVESARQVGVFRDFHIWSDRPIAGAKSHRLKKASGKEPFLQLRVLQYEVKKLKYDYFVWLDADSLFLRHPGNVLRALQGAPVHASLESDLSLPDPALADWGICRISNFIKLMRFRGVRSRGIFTVNHGFWVVHRDVINTFGELIWDFWSFCGKVGYRFKFEPLLAYGVQMLCGNPYIHTLKTNADVWAPDSQGHFAGIIPKAENWDYHDAFSGETFEVKPAIVHAMHSKRALAAKMRNESSSRRANKAELENVNTCV